ncbi:hypothetical protein ACH4M4_22495 [Streptomyces sp. NPDC017254]|uniref:hypothetical protein n=1 Tax=unclassified Streptomyces TaxID=2593676 RepID=UPI00379B6A37
MTSSTSGPPARGDLAPDSPQAVPVLDSLTDPPPAPLPGLIVLRALAADAARRAAALLDDAKGTPGGGSSGEAAAGSEGVADADGVDDTTADIVRFVAVGGDIHLELAAGQLGVSVRQMRFLAIAHRFGGRPAVATCLAPRPADPDVLAAAEHAVQPLRPSPTAPMERRHNHLTDALARVQLRYGPDLFWHPYIERHGAWQPAAAPHADPAAAYRAARTALRAAARS